MAESKTARDNTGAFETQLAELESIVERMEGGELTLDTSLQIFERGVELSRACLAALQQAEMRVSTLERLDVDASIMANAVDSGAACAENPDV